MGGLMSGNYVLIGGMICSAVVFYKLADIEGHSRLLWPALSVLVWTLLPRVWAGDLLSEVIGQVLLFFGIAVVRALAEERKSGK